MDPVTGTFLQRDPVWGVVGSMSVSYNPYLYAGANPTNWTDPSGKIAPILIIGGAIGLLGSAVGRAVTRYGCILNVPAMTQKSPASAPDAVNGSAVAGSSTITSML